MPNSDTPTNSGLTTAPEEEEEEEEFVVEQIINHRVTKKGKLEYYLKWKGFSNADNTWEPAENLNCKDLVEAYESMRVKDKKEEKKKPAKKITEEEEKKNKQVKRKTSDESAPKKKKKSDKRANGFERGMVAEEILGATETSGEVHFLIKWKGVNDAELVPSKVANLKIPQMVIAFYEARLTWSTNSNKSSDETEEQESSPKKNGTNETVADEATEDEAPSKVTNEESALLKNSSGDNGIAVN